MRRRWPTGSAAARPEPDVAGEEEVWVWSFRFSDIQKAGGVKSRDFKSGEERWEEVREFVGVKSPLDLIFEVDAGTFPVDSVFKREALMFNRIGCPQAENFIKVFNSLPHLFPTLLTSTRARDLASRFNHLTKHPNYLLGERILFETPLSAEGQQLNLLEADSDFQRLKSLGQPIEQLLIEGFRKADLGVLLEGGTIEPNDLPNYIPKMEPTIAPVVLALQYYVRQMSIQLRVLDRIDAYPILSEIVPQIISPQAAKSDVIDVVIKALPMPDDTVSWEQIIEYHSDPDSQSKFFALRNWMSEVARSELAPPEVEEKLEYLLDQYQRHMKLHRMKTNVGTLETVVTTGAEVLGDLVSFKWGKAAEALFSLRRRKVTLIEGELRAPGNEVAYIVKAREAFESR